MSDDPRSPEEEAEASATATEGEGEGEGKEKEEEKKLSQQVEIKDAGPCRKHIKVSIPRADIDERLNKKFSDMVTDAAVPGYRPGKAPRKLIEKRFYRDVSEQLKAELLLQSLQQLGEEQHLNPISQPEIDPFKIEMPKEGPLDYEFEIEVAPEFELPEYKGLKLKRPVRDIAEAEVETAERRLLARHGTLVPKDGPADLEDYLVTDVTTRLDGKELNKMDEITVKVDPRLAFKDGVVKDFGDKMKGVRAGQSRKVDVEVSPNASDPELRGKTIEATFEVKDIKAMRLPELTHEFLHQLGVHSPEQLREKVRVSMNRQLEYEQRRSARGQVLQHIAAAATWELPRDLLARQVRKTLARRLMELRSAGYSEEEIRGHAAVLQQNAMATTERALKEHFVLQKIAEVEKLEVSDEDIDFEIETMAAQTDESPRRVRARLEKEEMLETLATEILERKALDLVLDGAQYEDVPFQPETAVGTVEEQAVPGEPEEFEAEEPSKES